MHTGCPMKTYWKMTYQNYYSMNMIILMAYSVPCAPLMINRLNGDPDYLLNDQLKYIHDTQRRI